MLFKTDTILGIIDGSITVTFRGWTRPQARAGGRYRVQDRGFIVVDDVRIEPVAKIAPADARRAGFADRDDLLRFLGRRASAYRVAFHYDGTHDPRARLSHDVDLSPSGFEQLSKRLRALDERSAAGPWTRRALELIEKRPGVVSTELATRFGMERFAFKANVRKLKALGLTHSLEVGYELSPRGGAFVRSLRAMHQRR